MSSTMRRLSQKCQAMTRKLQEKERKKRMLNDISLMQVYERIFLL